MVLQRGWLRIYSASQSKGSFQKGGVQCQLCFGVWMHLASKLLSGKVGGDMFDAFPDF